MALKDFVTKARPEPEASPPAFTPPPPPIQAQPAPVRPPPAPERSSAPSTLLDASVEFTGTIRCRESIRIDGHCEGELYCEDSVIIGEPAVLRMAIAADTVAVAGQVHGDITAQRKITLQPTARVFGNLRTPGIVIQEGAQLEGRIMIGDEVPAAKAARSERAQAQAEAPASAASEAPAPLASDPARPRKPTTPTSSAPPPVS